MASTTPLQGTELVDCARANAKQGIETAAYQCGYGNDLNKFASELRQACEEMNLQVKELNELITDQDLLLEIGTGEVIAPTTASEL
ncbi:MULTISPECIES: hypothetical protein [Calothrix]|uniref:Uncharacterized protein n=2 Tax=Calothrix TaxID=1186 RepID=A0ABR8AAJ0_9CYAN|nr:MULTISPECIES: hypothetical protein [Calothrix]BAY63996.1 hypothetical protein NIES22_40860 [Calothrix brevissima NIES-22]MBD2197015.1 hypothetical protein [Calothrix parietina FACHB-288]MBD2205298.1 hypothetical protein [Calothrix sp. FACHB-168]MBD2220071.1 hypothetical protein [Calothrix sp. FACHB-1219]MBD2225566.1 hypothetical protein [Calothrix anomala FACHB-343]